MTDTVVVRNVIVLATQHPCGRLRGMVYPARIDTRRADPAGRVVAVQP